MLDFVHYIEIKFIDSSALLYILYLANNLHKKITGIPLSHIFIEHMFIPC